MDGVSHIISLPPLLDLRPKNIAVSKKTTAVYINCAEELSNIFFGEQRKKTVHYEGLVHGTPAHCDVWKS